MGARELAATEVKNRFGRVLREVTRSGGPVVIKRGNEPVAVILSISEYERLQRQPSLLAERRRLVESAFGMWSTRDDIDENWLEAGRSRWISAWNDERDG